VESAAERQVHRGDTVDAAARDLHHTSVTALRRRGHAASRRAPCFIRVTMRPIRRAVATESHEQARLSEHRHDAYEIRVNVD